MVNVVVEFSKFGYHFAERLHEERCDCHSKEQNKCPNKPLFVRPWCVVAEPNCGQRSEKEVCHDN